MQKTQQSAVQKRTGSGHMQEDKYVCRLRHMRKSLVLFVAGLFDFAALATATTTAATTANTTAAFWMPLQYIYKKYDRARQGIDSTTLPTTLFVS